jgi:hypothetical protein
MGAAESPLRLLAAALMCWYVALLFWGFFRVHRWWAPRRPVWAGIRMRLAKAAYWSGFLIVAARGLAGPTPNDETALSKAILWMLALGGSALCFAALDDTVE